MFRYKIEIKFEKKNDFQSYFLYLDIHFRAERDRQKRDVETILKGVRHLGKLHDFNNEDEQDFLNFGEFIYQMDDLPMQKRMRMVL